MRHILAKIPVAPGVERIAVAGEIADDPSGFLEIRRRQGREFEPGFFGHIQHQLRRSARAGHNAHAPPLRPGPALAGGKKLDQLVKFVHFDRSVRPKHRGEHPLVSGDTAGMGRNGLARPLRLPDLKDDDRFSRRLRPCERRDIAFRRRNRLGEGCDHLGFLVVNHIVEHVRCRDDGLVSRRGDQAEPKSADVREHADADASALRNQADIAGQFFPLAADLKIGSAPSMRADDPHAVRPAQRDARFATEADNLGLRVPSPIAGLPEPAAEDDRRPCPRTGQLPESRERAFGRDAKGHDVRGRRQGSQIRITGKLIDRFVTRIDRVDRSRKAETAQRVDDIPPNRRFRRCADHRYGTRCKKRIQVQRGWHHEDSGVF